MKRIIESFQHFVKHDYKRICLLILGVSFYSGCLFVNNFLLGFIGIVVCIILLLLVFKLKEVDSK